MLTHDEISDLIASAINGISLPQNPVGLYRPIDYTLETGGKRLRPLLVLAVCSALGGDVAKAVEPALGIEIFHNFTLLHDDVMDKADIRRGHPTVHVKWDDNTAILSGDAMLTLAYMYIAKSSPEFLHEALELFNKTAMEVYEGQQYDMDFEKRKDITVAQYLDMIRLKTSVLLGCACRMGAIVAGADEAKADAFYQYGVNLGMAFQLKDDWLDTYGDPTIFGKGIGGDIVNEKKTWLLVTALSEAREELLDILAEDLEDRERIRQVTAVYDSLKLNERSIKLINEYSDKAVAAIADAGLDLEGRNFFTNLALKSACRDH